MSQRMHFNNVVEEVKEDSSVQIPLTMANVESAEFLRICKDYSPQIRIVTPAGRKTGHNFKPRIF
jgi:hypothetical protein